MPLVPAMKTVELSEQCVNLKRPGGWFFGARLGPLADEGGVHAVSVDDGLTFLSEHGVVIKEIVESTFDVFQCHVCVEQQPAMRARGGCRWGIEPAGWPRGAALQGA